jgi:hypothetical protein
MRVFSFHCPAKQVFSKKRVQDFGHDKIVSRLQIVAPLQHDQEFTLFPGRRSQSRAWEQKTHHKLIKRESA